jgi:hypothetical protein
MKSTSKVVPQPIARWVKPIAKVSPRPVARCALRPQSVTIIVFGYDAYGGKGLMKASDRDDFPKHTVTDLRRHIMHNPETGVARGASGLLDRPR